MIIYITNANLCCQQVGEIQIAAEQSRSSIVSTVSSSGLVLSLGSSHIRRLWIAPFAAQEGRAVVDTVTLLCMYGSCAVYLQGQRKWKVAFWA